MLTNRLNEHHLFCNLQVQEVPQDKFQGHGLFCGPILRVQCSSGATFLDPVTIQLPVSLGNKLVDIPQPSKCHVRILFHSSKRECWQWVDFSDRLENPASYDGKVVKFMVQGFSLYVYREFRLYAVAFLDLIRGGIMDIQRVLFTPFFYISNNKIKKKSKNINSLLLLLFLLLSPHVI